MTGSADQQYAFCGHRLDGRRRELTGPDGAPVPLTSKAFDVLLQLIERREQVLGKEELLAAVWPRRVVEENNLTQAVSALRKALGGDASDHRYIITVPGRGYRFVAAVHDHDDDATVADGPAASSTGAALMPWRRAIALGALLFALALFAIAAWSIREAPTIASTLPGGTQATMAVLPFRSLSSGPRDQLLELGLAETLITRLGRSNALRVRSLGSAQRAALLQPDALAAGRELEAAYVVDGTTQRVGDQVRINARLLSVAKGTTVWTDTFDAHIDRVFTVQDQISVAVTSALSLSPLAAAARGHSACDGDDPAAYRALLGAQYRLHRRSPDTLAAFQRTLALDPTCARGYAGLAITYLFMAHNDGDPREVFPLAKAAAAQALRVDSEVAEAHMAQGRQQQLHAWAWADAEASLRRALELNPSMAEAHFGLAHLLVSTGRFAEGLVAARQARELDPLSPLINALEGGFLTAAQRPDEARVAVQRALDLQPDFWIALLIRGGMALDRGDHAAAIADLTRAAERSQRASQVLAMLAVAHAAAGDRPRAQAIRRELEARAAAGYVPATSLAAVRNALGETDAALDLLERAYDERDIRVAFLGVDARWNNLRSQPRFRALAGRLALNSAPAAGRY